MLQCSQKTLRKHLIKTLSPNTFGAIFVLAVFLEVTTKAHAQSKIATPSPFADNPASSAYLLDHSTALTLSPLTVNDVKVRYVGSEPITKKEGTPINISEMQMGAAWKLSKRMTLGIADILPPVSVDNDIKEIPVVILNSVNLVDLGIHAQVKYGASVYGSYLVDDRLAVGAAAKTRSIGVNATAQSARGERILNGQFNMTSSNVVVGFNSVVIPHRLRLGLATSVLSSNVVSTQIDTPLVNQEKSGSLGKTSRSSQAFGDVQCGIEFSPNQLSSWGADLMWRRADKSQKEFSLVDITEKKKDIHDTVSIAMATRYRSSTRESMAAGFSYEPSAVGAGSKGESGTSGFGMRETVMLYSGYGDLFPAWTIAIGLQYGADLAHGPIRVEQTKSKSQNPRTTTGSQRLSQQSFFDRLTFSLGVRYRRASLGVDQQGELPGAYSQTKVTFPMTVLTTF